MKKKSTFLKLFLIVFCSVAPIGEFLLLAEIDLLLHRRFDSFEILGNFRSVIRRCFLDGWYLSRIGSFVLWHREQLMADSCRYIG